MPTYVVKRSASSYEAAMKDAQQSFPKAKKITVEEVKNPYKKRHQERKFYKYRIRQ